MHIFTTFFLFFRRELCLLRIFIVIFSRYIILMHNCLISCLEGKEHILLTCNLRKTTGKSIENKRRKCVRVRCKENTQNESCWHWKKLIIMNSFLVSLNMNTLQWYYNYKVLSTNGEKKQICIVLLVMRLDCIIVIVCSKLWKKWRTC